MMEVLLLPSNRSNLKRGNARTNKEEGDRGDMPIVMYLHSPSSGVYEGLSINVV